MSGGASDYDMLMKFIVLGDTGTACPGPWRPWPLPHFNMSQNVAFNDHYDILWLSLQSSFRSSLLIMNHRMPQRLQWIAESVGCKLEPKVECSPLQGVGKSCLLLRFADGTFSENYLCNLTKRSKTKMNISTWCVKRFQTWRCYVECVEEWLRMVLVVLGGGLMLFMFQLLCRYHWSEFQAPTSQFGWLAIWTAMTPNV